MLKQNPLDEQNVIEPMKVDIKKENLKMAESVLQWRPIYTSITVVLVLIASGYILFKIIN